MDGETVIILVNFNYWPDENPGHMLINVAAGDRDAATECVNTAHDAWAKEETPVKSLEEYIEEELKAANIRFMSMPFDVIDLDATWN